MTGQKMSAHLIESLADELRNWLEDNELWSDCRIYFNGKAYSTDDGSGQYDSTKHHGWYELEDIDPHDYFEYAGGVLSMSFEGPLYEVLNGYLGEYSREVCEKFDDIFHRYGLYYELGNSWNLSAYEE